MCLDYSSRRDSGLETRRDLHHEIIRTHEAILKRQTYVIILIVLLLRETNRYQKWVLTLMGDNIITDRSVTEMKAEGLKMAVRFET